MLGFDCPRCSLLKTPKFSLNFAPPDSCRRSAAPLRRFAVVSPLGGPSSAHSELAPAPDLAFWIDHSLELFMKLKFLAAAAALLCGVNAHAAIDTTGPKSEVFAMVWDDAIGTYAIDLGVTMNDLFSGAAVGQLGAAVTGSNAWAAYAAADTDRGDFMPFSGTRWALFALDTEGDIFDQGSLNLLLSTRDASSPMNDEAAFQSSLETLKTLTGNFGLNVFPAVQGDAYNAFGTIGHFTEALLTGRWNAGNAIGSASSLFNCTDTGNFGNGPAACVASTSTVTFDGATFSAVAAIPEPGTYALMFAGLLTVGFFASRRRG
jgi:PEP-CTERM motif